MRFILEPNQLTIIMEGFERLWALKRRLQVPHYAIQDIDYIRPTPGLSDYRSFFRLGGTIIPWRFLAGSYHRRGQREFFYIKMRQPGILAITLKPETTNYDKIRVTCLPEVAQDVADWWQARK